MKLEGDRGHLLHHYIVQKERMWSYARLAVLCLCCVVLMSWKNVVTWESASVLQCWNVYACVSYVLLLMTLTITCVCVGMWGQYMWPYLCLFLPFYREATVIPSFPCYCPEWLYMTAIVICFVKFTSQWGKQTRCFSSYRTTIFSGEVFCLVQGVFHIVVTQNTTDRW